MLFWSLFSGKSGEYDFYSRDYKASYYIPCKVSDCPANNGRKECISPACINIGSDGVCEMYKKLKNYEENKEKD